MGRTLAQVVSGMKRPLPGSPWERDLLWARDRSSTAARGNLQGLLNYLAPTVAEYARTAEEFHVAIEELLRSQSRLLPMPGSALVRTLLEVTVQVCWLFELGITPTQRLCRLALTFMGTLEGNRDTYKLFPFQEATHLQVVQDSVIDGRAMLESSGFTLKIQQRAGRPDRVTQVALGDTVLRVDEVSTTEKANTYLPGNGWFWAIGSGAAHAKPWFTQGIQGPSSDLAVMVTQPTLELADAVRSFALPYVGKDPLPQQRSTHTRRVALLKAARGGSPEAPSYEEYAQSLRERNQA